MRLATFSNPEFYKQQVYAKPVWKSGRIENGRSLHRFITYARAYPEWLSLPFIRTYRIYHPWRS